MDDEIELMCSLGWAVTFAMATSGGLTGTAIHWKYGKVQKTQANARKLTERLFIDAQRLDPILHEEAAL